MEGLHPLHYAAIALLFAWSGFVRAGLGFGGAVLVLPLYIPVLIFGAGAVSAAAGGANVDGILAILGALLALTISLGPLAVSAGLKISSGN